MLMCLVPLMEHLLTKYLTAGTKTLRTSHINLKIEKNQRIFGRNFYYAYTYARGPRVHKGHKEAH